MGDHIPKPLTPDLLLHLLLQEDVEAPEIDSTEPSPMSQEEAISRLSGFRVSSLGLRTSSSDFGALGQGCRAQDL